MVNQAALDGWVKSVDAKSGRAFYANHLTRVTQWDAPTGWNEDSPASAPPPPPPANGLPAGWEEMKDPSTGRSFYVDHERQITTWTKPTTAGGSQANAPAAAAASSSSIWSSGRSVSSNASSSRHQQHSIQRTTSSVSNQSSSRRDRSWSHDASYFRPSNTVQQDVDFSDSLSTLDFKVQKVEDRLRPNCASCEEIFNTFSKRRHHCRLCGDVFCHECSNHRASLPLEGAEFEKPVRICDSCNPEVEQGNFFSLRRYLTPLTLYDPPETERDLDEEEGVATHSTVSAALSALTSDLNALIHNGTDVNSKLANTKPEILVPAITKHMTLRATSDRAIWALSSLLSLGSMVGQTKWAMAVLEEGAVDDILTLLDRSGSDRRTLFVQEQAAKTIFYLSDAQVMKELARKGGDATSSLDIPRSLRAMLDHSSNAKNPNLQRWAASSIRHLVCEDERRTTSSANDIAASMAVGQEYFGAQYESFLPELISTGGIMILCSLIGADDSDTRAHATGALGATLDATRAMNESLATLYDMTGGQAGRISTNSDGDIVRAIVQGGGCGNALSQLVLSAENGTARMGCDFCASLVMPLLEDARGTATLDEGYDCRSDTSGLGACREAALAMASGSVLTALLGIMRNDMGSSSSRPMALKKTVMESLAAIAMAVGEMTKANPHATEDAVVVMLEEGIVTVLLAVLESSSSQTLAMSSSKQSETPSSRIREAAGIVISAMAMCSADAMMELQSCHAISAMLAAMSDITGTSTLRGDGAPKCLGMLQTAAALLTYSQHDGDTSDADLVDRLLEAVDAGAISTLSRILFTKVEWDSQDKAVGAMKARDAACRMLTAMFGMARTDQMAHQRLWDVVDADAYQRNPPRNIVTGALGVLQAAGVHGRNSLLGGGQQTGTHYHAAVMDLVESSLYAVGSMCGSTVVPGLEQESSMMENNEDDDVFAARRKEASAVACDILTAKSRNTQQSILPTMLVGGFGEKTLTASLRLALAIAQNGNMEQHAKLAGSGIMVPISDLLKSAMSSGDQFRFTACLALVRYCGPHVGAGQNANGGLSSVQAAIRTATHVLAVPVDPSAPPEHVANTEALKKACIETLESLSSNASLWSAISKDALPSLVSYLHSACDFGTDSRKTTLCGALRAIARIVGLQSHAVSAARAGLAEPLGRLLIKGTDGTTLEDGDDELPLLALEVLHVLTANKDARKAAGLLESGVIEGVCCALGKSATSKPKKPSDGRADICFWSIEILHYYVKDLGGDFATVLQSPMATSFIEVVAREPRLIKAFCSTLLLKTSMKISKFDADDEDETLEIPKLYGPPLVLVKDKCSGFENTHAAAMNLFFSIFTLSCAMENSASDSIWETILLVNQRHSDDDAPKLAATLCSHFLKLLSDDDKKGNPFMPTNPRQKAEYETISCPLVRHALLEGLKSALDDQASDFYMISMLVAFEVPRVCLTIWQDPNLVQLAFGIIRLMVDSHEEDLVHIFVESKQTLLSLFDMLNASTETEEVEEIRSVVASILCSLAENGLLTQAVEKFDIKSAAIGGLAAACLAEEPEHDENDDRLATSATLSSRCMECLVDLLKGNSKKGIKLAASDANSIASRLGQKICRMVISRFLERAKLSQYDVDDDDNVMDAPDVKMLCAMAQHESALKILSSLGGISALALVAGEGELSAIIALKKADPTVLLDANGHQSIMKLVLEDSVSREIETAALELLAELALRSKGRNAIVESGECGECIHHALYVIGAVTETPVEEPVAIEEEEESEEEPVEEEDSDEDEEEDVEESEEDDEEETTEEEEEEKPTKKKHNRKKAVKAPPKKKPVTKKPVKKKPAKKQKEVVKPKVDPSLPSAELKSAAVSFLSNLAVVEQCRTEILNNQEFIPTLSELSKQHKTANLQAQSIRLVAAMAPFATVSGGPVTADTLVETLIDAMEGSSPTATKEIATDGLTVLFHGASSELQSKAVAVTAKIFQSSVKKTSIARSTESAVDRANMARLTCSLAGLIVQVSAKDHLRTLLCNNVDLLKSMIHLIEWRYDTRGTTTTTEEYFVYWDAAVSFSIQHLATVICGTLESQEGLNIAALTKTVLTMARPGKAPRKTCDFQTALERVIASKRDVTGAVAARRILASLLD